MKARSLSEPERRDVRAPSPAASGGQLSKPARLLVAGALTALGFGAIVAGTIIIGGGRDFHAVRVAAALVFMLPVAIILVWREQTPLVRIVGVLAACSWVQPPGGRSPVGSVG